MNERQKNFLLGVFNYLIIFSLCVMISYLWAFFQFVNFENYQGSDYCEISIKGNFDLNNEIIPALNGELHEVSGMIPCSKAGNFYYWGN